MKHVHITLELIQSMVDGSTRASEFVHHVVKHLSDLCPLCRDNLKESKKFFEHLKESSGGSRRSVLEAEPIKWIEEIKQLPEEKRLPFLHHSLRELADATDIYAQALLAESARHVPENPSGILAWATLAFESLTAAGSNRQDLYALALGYMGNGRRLTGEFHEADKLLWKARQAARLSGQETIMAEIGSLRGSLLTSLRRFDEAADDLILAAALSQTTDRILYAKTLIKIGIVCDLSGNSTEAIKTTKEALRVIDEIANPHLYLYARFNLAQHLFVAGRFAECRNMLEEDKDRWASEESSWAQLRLKWLEARLAFETGDERMAERMLRTVRRSFIQRAEGFETALVTLDLVLLYHRQERVTELVPLVQEMLEVFLTNEMHPEAFSVLRVLADNIQATTISEVTIRKCYQVVRGASATPHAADWMVN